jgi:hypothetical protein
MTGFQQGYMRNGGNQGKPFSLLCALYASDLELCSKLGEGVDGRLVWSNPYPAVEKIREKLRTVNEDHSSWESDQNLFHQLELQRCRACNVEQERNILEQINRNYRANVVMGIGNSDAAVHPSVDAPVLGPAFLSFNEKNEATKRKAEAVKMALERGNVKVFMPSDYESHVGGTKFMREGRYLGGSKLVVVFGEENYGADEDTKKHLLLTLDRIRQGESGIHIILLVSCSTELYT